MTPSVPVPYNSWHTPGRRSCRCVTAVMALAVGMCSSYRRWPRLLSRFPQDVSGVKTSFGAPQLNRPIARQPQRVQRHRAAGTAAKPRREWDDKTDALSCDGGLQGSHRTTEGMCASMHSRCIM